MARFPLPFRIPFFRIFYSTTYTSLFVVVLCLLAITPAALIFTAVQASAWQYPFMIGGTYVLTALLSLFIYTSRLFTNRTVLAAVGKSWIPVEEGEVGHHVRKMIANALQRSATVAWEGRPRDLSTEAEEVAEAAEKEQEKEDHEKSTHLFRHGRRHEDQYLVGSIIQVDPQAPPWGHVHHPGWSSPSKFDTQLTPHIYFTTVIRELPNLIEAKAVSLAPPDPAFTPADPSHPPLADAQIVELLQRPATSGMRAYLTQLVELRLIEPPVLAEKFLTQYEHARFSGRPLLELQFRALMASFADLLTSIAELPPDLQSEHAVAEAISSNSISQTSSFRRAPSTRSEAATSVSSNDSAIRHRSATPGLPSVYASIAGRSTRDFLHIPNATTRTSSHYSTPRNSQRSPLRRTPSQETLGSVIRTSPPPADSCSLSSRSLSSSSGSSRSLRSARSVIRLTPSPNRRPGGLPYEWVGEDERDG